MQPVSIYIHIPFCSHRCGYCDFNTYAGLEALIPDYTEAVCEEIRILTASADEKMCVGTIYFGGGTPSLLPISNLEKVITTLNDRFCLVDSIEVSLEANPGTVSKEYLTQLHTLGVNRLSLGMQSANQNELALLERQHSHIDVVNAIEWSRKAGFNNLNLDLIYGLPFQMLCDWMANVETALSFQPEHLSLYSLTIEDGTPLSSLVKTGTLPKPDPDEQADMYEAASTRLMEAGYTQYEISNWTLCNPDGRKYSCKHNLQYWRNLPYIGLGAGAHGFISHQRTINVPTPSAYIRKLINKSDEINIEFSFPQTPATYHINQIDIDTEISETMIMGLRLVSEGVSNRDFQERFGISLLTRFRNEIERLIGVGLLEWTGSEEEILRLTHKGYLLGNQVFLEFI